MIDLKRITSRGANATSLIGLALEGSRLEGVWLKRSGDALQVAGSFAVTLTLDPLTAAPELVGREIRNHLDAAEIRERRCVVALPLKWALAGHAKVPQLADADATSFLQLEAERSFPCDVATLITATSRCKLAGDGEQATFVGMPRGHVAALEAALRAAAFDFLPPKISQWQQMMSRHGTGKLRKVGLVAASVVGLVVVAFLVQQIILWRYQSRWADMKTQVTDLEATQAQIKQYRPWFDESARSLSILRQLTLSFPEDGVVTAKTIEIREANVVTCTGTAKDMKSLLAVQKKLFASGNVADLKLNRIQGKSPMQFTFDFRWVEGGSHAN